MMNINFSFSYNNCKKNYIYVLSYKSLTKRQS